MRAACNSSFPSVPVFNGFEDAAVQRCADHVATGQLLGFATETVYGLGARADDDNAVAQIFQAKGRPSTHPLIVHVLSMEAALVFASELPAAAQRLAAAFWPGPLTLILPRRADVAESAAAGQSSVGLRVPSHPVAMALLQALAGRGVAGVAAPSANRFGHVSPTTAGHVQSGFGPELWVLDGGPCDVGIESAIVDCTREQPALLRPGQLSRARLQSVLHMELAAPDGASPRAPGTLAAHYAPFAPLQVLAAAELTARVEAIGWADKSIGVYSRELPLAGFAGLWRQMPAHAAEVAHDLFAVLRSFDSAGVTHIWVQQPPPGPEWEGVRDRLQRAASA